MIKRITEEIDINSILKNIDVISVSQDKHSFYRDLLDHLSDSEEDLTLLIYILDKDSNQATLTAERNLYSSYLRKFLVIKNSNKTLWEVLKKNRTKVYRDLLNNDKIDIEIKSLNKSTALGVPIKSDNAKVIGAIWILGNIQTKSAGYYKNLKNVMEEIALRIARKEKLDMNVDGLH